MAPVPPGDKTGFYYIIVANLPWSCTWQRLKDFTRNHPDGTYLNVDHAYVYPGSNSGATCSGYGWVRIIGKPDFKKALAHLSGGVFENRILMADGRNETETTILRDIVSTRQSPTRSRQDSATRSEYFTTPSVYQQSAATQAPHVTYAGQEFYQSWNHSQQQMASYRPPSPSFSAGSSYYPSPPSASYESTQGIIQVPPSQDCYPISTTPYFYVGNMAPIYACLPPALTYIPAQPRMHSPVSVTDPNLSANISHGTVQPEARKIIITRLSHDIKDADLIGLVRRVSSKYRPSTQTEKARPIHSIELPRHADGKSKGHAFVVFDSQGLAEHAVSALNGLQFQSRSLNAKLAKEGVEPVGGYGNSEPQEYWQAAEGKLATFQPHKPSGSSLVVQSDGSSKDKKSEKRESSKSKDKEKKEKDSKQPLVANGSGGSRKHHRY